MQYTLDDIEEALGSKYKPGHDYILARKVDVVPKSREGWQIKGTIPDFTTNEAGTMTIMGRPAKPKDPGP
jgi:hypothetical protein